MCFAVSHGRVALAAKERRWSLKTNLRTRGGYHEKKRKRRVTERRRLRCCGNGNVNVNVSCLRKKEGFHRA